MRVPSLRNPGVAGRYFSFRLIFRRLRRLLYFRMLRFASMFSVVLHSASVCAVTLA